MVNDPKGAVETLRERINSGERGGCDADQSLLIDFSDELRLRREDYGHYRHEKLLRHLVRMGEHAEGCLHDSILEDADDAPEEVFYEAKDAAEVIVRWIHDTYDVEEGSQETNRDYRVAFRLLAKHVTRDDEIPETHDWISTKTTRDYDPEPDEADMLDLETEVKPMVEMARNTRDAALIYLQFEGGFRGGELYDMRVGDVTDGEHSMKVRVDGKRGEHDVHLIDAVPFVRKWLVDHPGGNEDHLWSKLTTPDRVSYQMFLKAFRESAERADVDKPVTPTNFRKSNAYWLSNRKESQAFIEDRQGRARGSPVISRYIAKFSGETQEKQYAAMHGIDIGDEGTEPEAPPMDCPNCGEKTPAEGETCIHCNYIIDYERRQAIDAVLNGIDESLVDEEEREARKRLLDARTTVDRSPDVMSKDKLHKFASSLSSE